MKIALKINIKDKYTYLEVINYVPHAFVINSQEKNNFN